MSKGDVLLSIVDKELERDIICVATEKAFLQTLNLPQYSGESLGLTRLSGYLVSGLAKHYLESALSRLNSSCPANLCIQRFAISPLPVVEPATIKVEENFPGNTYDEDYVLVGKTNQDHVEGTEERDINYQSDSEVGSLPGDGNDGEGSRATDRMGKVETVDNYDDDTVPLEEVDWTIRNTVTASPLNLVTNKDIHGIEACSSCDGDMVTAGCTDNAELTDKTAGVLTGESGVNFSRKRNSSCSSENSLTNEDSPFLKKYTGEVDDKWSAGSSVTVNTGNKLEHVGRIDTAMAPEQLRKVVKSSLTTSPKEKDSKTECNLCGKTLYSKRTLKVHMREHTGERPFSCKVCSKTFASRNSMIRHQLTHSDERRHSCEHCDKTFLYPYELKTHERSHTGEKPYACSLCGKAFGSKSHMTAHERAHAGDKRYGCDYCSKTFRRPNQLKSHERLHTGEKPYSCETCDERFMFPDQLKRHVGSVHMGVQPFACEVCGKSFILRRVFEVHKRIHTGERPFACKNCDKTFSDPSSLWRHGRKGSCSRLPRTRKKQAKKHSESVNR